MNERDRTIGETKVTIVAKIIPFDIRSNEHTCVLRMNREHSLSKTHAFCVVVVCFNKPTCPCFCTEFTFKLLVLDNGLICVFFISENTGIWYFGSPKLQLLFQFYLRYLKEQIRISCLVGCIYPNTDWISGACATHFVFNLWVICPLSFIYLY